MNKYCSQNRNRIRTESDGNISEIKTRWILKDRHLLVILNMKHALKFWSKFLYFLQTHAVFEHAGCIEFNFKVTNRTKKNLPKFKIIFFFVLLLPCVTFGKNKWTWIHTLHNWVINHYWRFYHVNSLKIRFEKVHPSPS